MTLRPYQSQAVDSIRLLFRQGKRRVLLHLATGGGKTVVFSYILKSLVERGKRGLMVVRGRHLVDQASDRLTREQVPHGILMNGRPTKLGMPLYVCSIDTLRARDMAPPADLIVIDEAHMATSPSYRDLIARYPDAFILGVTATPYMHGSIEHIASEIVSPITIGELVDQGFLVAPRYIVPVTHDLSGVKVASTGDYDVDQLSTFMEQPRVIGDIVTNWLRFGESRPTICFASNVLNSQHLVEKFNEAGIAAEHVEAGTPETERHQVLERLRTGKTKIVSNVGILCTGVDMPHVSCIVMARPTKSLNLYIQQAGRGTRPYTDKKDFLLLDHANNVKEHGFIDMPHEVFLSGYPKSKKGKPPPPIKTCPVCYAALPAATRVCYCGHEFQVEKRDNREDGELREITRDNLDVEVRSFIKEQKRIRKAKGYKPGWVFFQVKNRYGAEIAEKYIPQRKAPDWVRRKSMPG